MKNLFTVLVTIFLMPGTLVPAQETEWEKVKDFLSSRPMMLVYGAALGAGTVKLLLHTPQNQLESLTDRVKKSQDADETANTTTQFKTVIAYLENITRHQCITVKGDTHAYSFKVDIVDDFATCQAASDLLQMTKSFLQYYNGYQVYNGLPTINVSDEILFGHPKKFSEEGISSSDLLLQKITISMEQGS